MSLKGRPRGAWQEYGRTETGAVREQAITLEGKPGPARWRRIELALDASTEGGDATIRLWSNLPSGIGAKRIAALYRARWRIEAMFGPLESVLNSERPGLGHPCAALPRFTVAILAYNVLARSLAAWSRRTSSYEAMLTAVPLECWPPPEGTPAHLAERLLFLARRINPRQVATS